MKRAYTALFTVGVVVGLGMWLYLLGLGAVAVWPSIRDWSSEEYGHPFGWLGPLAFWSAILVLLHRRAQRLKR